MPAEAGIQRLKSLDSGLKHAGMTTLKALMIFRFAAKAAPTGANNAQCNEKKPGSRTSPVSVYIVTNDDQQHRCMQASGLHASAIT